MDLGFFFIIYFACSFCFGDTKSVFCMLSLIRVVAMGVFPITTI